MLAQFNADDASIGCQRLEKGLIQQSSGIGPLMSEHINSKLQKGGKCYVYDYQSFKPQSSPPASYLPNLPNVLLLPTQ